MKNLVKLLVKNNKEFYSGNFVITCKKSVVEILEYFSVDIQVVKSISVELF